MELLKMKKLLLLLVVGIILCSINLGMAEDLYYRQNSSIDLKIPCYVNDTYCSVSTICNLTVFYPNETIMIDNQQMTNQYSFHNYSIDNDNMMSLGNYKTSVVCSGDGESGYITFNIVVTSSGTEPTTSKSITFGIIIFVALFLSVFFLVLGFKFENMASLLVGLLLGLIFLIMAFQFLLLLPEVQAESPLHNQLATNYNILLWIFWVVCILVFIFITYSIVHAWQNKKKNKMRKWNLLMEDEY